MRVTSLVVALTLVGAWAASRPAQTAAGGSCPATVVRYQPAKHPTLGENAWVLARPAAAGIVAFLPNYPQLLRDGRVNRADALVLWRTGGQLVWVAPGGPPVVMARPVSGGRSFPVSAHPRFPSTGCWQLTARSGNAVAHIVVRVVETPARRGCDATPLAPSSRFALARPRSSGIAGAWSWPTPEGGALLYTHGHGPGGGNMKVPWWVRRGSGPSLEVAGTRLDAPGSFSQRFPAALAFSSHPPGYDAVFPSIVDVPAAGCWLLKVRTAQLAGVLVVRAIDFP